MLFIQNGHKIFFLYANKICIRMILYIEYGRIQNFKGEITEKIQLLVKSCDVNKEVGPIFYIPENK